MQRLADTIGKARAAPRRRAILLAIYLGALLAAWTLERRGLLPAGEEPVAPAWNLGNCNLDSYVDISDAVSALEVLLLGRPNELCLPLCDVSGDGRITVTDPIAVLNYLFRGSRWRASTPSPAEICDGRDNDCDWSLDEGCPGGGVHAVELTWNPVTLDALGRPETVRGYRVHIGTTSRRYTTARDAGADTHLRIVGLVPGVQLFFAVTAYDATGNQSDFSNEVVASPLFQPF